MLRPKGEGIRPARSYSANEVSMLVRRIPRHMLVVHCVGSCAVTLVRRVARLVLVTITFFMFVTITFVVLVLTAGGNAQKGKNEQTEN